MMIELLYVLVLLFGAFCFMAGHTLVFALNPFFYHWHEKRKNKWPQDYERDIFKALENDLR
jgi:hypothetical protein